jgi:subtilisin family serine protease
MARARSRPSQRKPAKLKKTTTMRADYDPRLQWLLEKEQAEADFHPWQVSKTADGTTVVEVIAEVRDPHRPVPGLTVHCIVGRIVTGTIPLKQIEEVRMHENVISLKAAVPLRPQLNVSVPEIRATAADLSPFSSHGGLDGSGMVLGFVDTGCDFRHRNFINAETGKSRILFLWDQRQAAAGDGSAGPGRQPAGSPYGREFTQEEITAALADPLNAYQALGYRPGESAHGTHVMDIAAGNGNETGRKGVAPAADIIFVEFDLFDGRSPNPLAVLPPMGNSKRLIDAVDYIFKKAQGRPCVVNLSLGTNLGPRDGTSPVERALDEFVQQGPGRVIVVSAGNFFHVPLHAAGRVAADQPSDLGWEVQPEDTTDNALEIWYSDKDEFVVEILGPPPDNVSIGKVALGESQTAREQGVPVMHVAHRRNDSGNHDNHVMIFMAGNYIPGRWCVRLHPKRVTDGHFHAWIEKDDAQEQQQSTFSSDCRSPSLTLASVASGRNTIVVGSYDPRDPQQSISSFSSAGPTRDGRGKPDLSAPGGEDPAVVADHGIVAARSELGGSMQDAGTSMAAPHVSGVCAVLLQSGQRFLNRTLAASELRDILVGVARKNPPAGIHDDQFGDGRISAVAALGRLVQLAPPVTAVAAEVHKPVAAPAADVNLQSQQLAELLNQLAAAGGPVRRVTITIEFQQGQPEITASSGLPPT